MALFSTTTYKKNLWTNIVTTLVLFFLTPLAQAAVKSTAGKQKNRTPGIISEILKNMPRKTADKDKALLNQPDLRLEREAEKLELRTEFLSSQNLYRNALIKIVMRAGREHKTKQAKLLWARAEFLAEKIYALSQQTYAYEPILKVKNKIDKLPFFEPVFKARLNWLTAKTRLRQGKVRDAKALSNKLGLVCEWLLLGPFDNERGRGFSQARAFETQKLILDEKQQGLKGLISWRNFQTAQPLGFIDLDACYQPNDECLAYAVCAVYSGKKTTAALRLGSDEMIAVWLNGKEIFRFTGSRPANFDQNVIGCKLQRGWNLLLLKVGDAKGSWGFYLRLTQLDGSALSRIRYSTDKRNIMAANNLIADNKHPEKKEKAPLPSPPLGADKPQTKVKQKEVQLPYAGAITTFSTRLKQEPKNHRLMYYLGWLLIQRQNLDINEQGNVRLLLRATTLAPKEGIYYLTFAQDLINPLAHIADRDENTRRIILEQAVRISPDAVAARIQLARYYLYDMGNIQRAGNIVNKAITANPLSLAAQTILHDIYTVKNWRTRAKLLRDKIIRRHPYALELLVRRGATELKNEQNKAALATYTKILETDYTLGVAGNGYIESCQRLGKVEALEKMLKHLLDIQPYQQEWLLRLCELYMNKQQYQKALQLLQKASQTNPAVPQFLVKKGQILQKLKRNEEAFKVWKYALQLKPELPEVKNYFNLFGQTQNTFIKNISNLRSFALKNKNYPIKPGASRLYLLSEIAGKINNDGTKSQIIHFVVRILDKKAARELTNIVISYEKNEQNLEIITARALRIDGKLENARVLSGSQARNILQFSPVNVGDIIEVAYRTNDLRLGFFGDYFGEIFYFKRFYPIIVSRYILEYPTQRKIYFHQTGKSTKAKIEKTAERTKRTWEKHNLPALEIESYMPSRSSLSSTIQVSTFSSWDDLASWYWHLIKNQYRITPQIKRQVHFITAGKNTALAKLTAIYRWVTNNINNVAWEFGVHGYKPYQVGDVFKRRFGDCKDKTALINVMAKVAGFKTCPVLLRALEETGPMVGRSYEDLTLPILNHFNHCISAIELNGKLIFLDGTAKYYGMDSVPTTDADARILLVKPDKGELAQLKAHKSTDNLWREESVINLSDNGKAVLRQTVAGRGIVANYFRAYFSGQYNSKLVLESIAEKHLGQVTVAEIKMREQEPLTDGLVTVNSTMRLAEALTKNKNTFILKLPNVWLCSKSGKGGPLPERLSIYCEESQRDYDLYLPMVFAIERSFTISLPPGYSLRNLPASVKRTHPFADFSADFKLEGLILNLKLNLKLKQYKIKRSDYYKFRHFCMLIDEINKLEFILEKKQ